MRRIGFQLMLLLLFGAASVYYFDLLDLKGQGGSVYDAVPLAAPVVLEYEEHIDLLRQLDAVAYADALQSYALPQRLVGDLSFLSKFKAAPELEGQFANKPAISALHLIGAKGFDLLHIAALDQRHPQWEHQVKELMTSWGFDIEERVYNEITVLRFQRGTEIWAMAATNTLWLCSHESHLVEEGISRLGLRKQLSKDEQFMALRTKLSAPSDVRVFINHNALKTILPLVFKGEGQAFGKKWSQMANWTGLGIMASEDGLLFNGFAQAHEGQGGYRVRGNKVQAFELAKVLSKQVALVQWEGQQDLAAIESMMGNLEGGQDQFLPYITDWMTGELAYVVMETYDKQIASKSALILHTSDSPYALQRLKQLNELIGDSVAEDSHREIPIYQLAEAEFFHGLFDNELVNMQFPYYSLLGDYVVFAPARETIVQLLNDYLDEAVLQSDMGYNHFISGLSAEAAQYTYCRPNALSVFIDEVLHAEDHEGRGVFSPIAVQQTWLNDLLFLNGYIYFDPEVQRSTKQLWKKNLLADVTYGPQLLRNYTNDELDVLVQDENHTLYLMNNVGDVLWKRNLDGPVLSEVYQIDFYKNEKLQYVLNTAGRIYVIDRKGRNVEGYPLRLAQKASTGMLVVNYDQRRNYRFFVPAENGSIYGYEWSGKPLNGWRPRKNTGVIEHPMQHVVHDGKDYISFVNDQGQFMALDRKGEPRFDAVAAAGAFAQNYRAITIKDELYWVNAREGQLLRINAKGQLVSKELLMMGPEDAFGVSQDPTGEWQLAVLGKKRLSLMDLDGQQIAGQNLPGLVHAELLSYPGNANYSNYWACADANGSSLYLYDFRAEMHPDFPIEGDQLPAIGDLFNKQGKQLITAKGAEVVAFTIR